MAGYQEEANRKAKKYGTGGKYGLAQLEKMVEVHFKQLETKKALYGLTPELVKEEETLKRIYKPFMKG